VAEPNLDSGGFAEHVGVEWLEDRDGFSRARIAVTDHHLQPLGVVHGGVYSSLAESVASRATALATTEEGAGAFGQSIHVTFLRSITAGHVNAQGRAIHRGRTTWVWDVEMTDDDGRLCAVARMTAAVRPIRRSDS
jgi:1,4-dihydroxy-2-naphthoyl-CoA hydrolase